MALPLARVSSRLLIATNNYYPQYVSIYVLTIVLFSVHCFFRMLRISMMLLRRVWLLMEGLIIPMFSLTSKRKQLFAGKEEKQEEKRFLCFFIICCDYIRIGTSVL